MTTGTDPISMLFNQQTQQGADQKGLSETFEVILKIFFWVIDYIPYINTWFINQYGNTIPSELTQLSAFSCPSFFTAKQVTHLQNVLDQRVIQLYKNQEVAYLGTPNSEKCPILSSDYISACVRALPSMPLTELFIHGPIAESDRDKLKTLITKVKTLVKLHLEVEEPSATYFTAKAPGMLETNQTITVFNLTLMGTKSGLSFDTNHWDPLNNHSRCTLTYTNVTPPDPFNPKKLTFK